MGADRPRRRAEGGSRQVKQETKKETAFAVSFFSPKRCFYIGRDVFIDFSNETGIMTMRDYAPRKGYWIQRCGAAAGRKAPPRVRQRCRRKGTSPCANGTVSVRIRRGGAARRWDESPPLQRAVRRQAGSAAGRPRRSASQEIYTVEDHTAAGEFSAEQTAYVICRPFLRERPIFLARPRRTDFHRRGVIL